MSDIQEEQKRLYKRAEENDIKERKYAGVNVVVNKELYDEYKGTLQEQINELQNRIDKSIEYIWSKKYEYGDLEEDNEDFDIDVYELLNILQGKEK